MSKIKNGGLDQYGAEPFEQQQFGTAGVEGVNLPYSPTLTVNCFKKIILNGHITVLRYGYILMWIGMSGSCAINVLKKTSRNFCEGSVCCVT